MNEMRWSNVRWFELFEIFFKHYPRTFAKSIWTLVKLAGLNWCFHWFPLFSYSNKLAWTKWILITRERRTRDQAWCSRRAWCPQTPWPTCPPRWCPTCHPTTCPAHLTPTCPRPTSPTCLMATWWPTRPRWGPCIPGPTKWEVCPTSNPLACHHWVTDHRVCQVQQDIWGLQCIWTIRYVLSSNSALVKFFSLGSVASSFLLQVANWTLLVVGKYCGC